MCTTKCWPFGSFLWNQNGIRISFFLFSLLLYFLFNFFGCECENMFKHLLVINFNLNMALQTCKTRFYIWINIRLYHSGLFLIVYDALLNKLHWAKDFLKPSIWNLFFENIQSGIYKYIYIYILDCFWLIYYYFGHMNIVNIEPILLLLFLGQVPLVLGF